MARITSHALRQYLASPVALKLESLAPAIRIGLM